MEQLKMVRDDIFIGEIRFHEGFFMRSYEIGDGPGWCKCLIDGSLGVDVVSEETFENKMMHDASVAPKNIFFLISPENEIAGTVTYQYSDDIQTGTIHMVGIDKRFQGRGLALPMCLYALRKMQEDGVKRACLTTDDWRLPAIKTYLKAGFKPVFYQPDMEERWSMVMEKLR